MSRDIQSVNPILAQWHIRWRKNRDFLAGKETVSLAGKTYLPEPVVGMSNDEYERFKLQVDFYPACISVMEGWMGLIFRKEPQFQSPENLQQIQYVITKDADSLEEFSRLLVRETFTTNLTGLLVDHPEANTGLTAANAIKKGYRPFLSLWRAESIMDYEFSIVNNQRVISYVRLFESESRILELELKDGVYQITTHYLTDGQVVDNKISIPTRLGKPLDFIPFKLVNTKSSRLPTSSHFEHMVDLNHEIYMKSGLLTQIDRFLANPIISAYGFEAEKDKDGKPIARIWNFGPGVVWEAAGINAKIEVKEFTGEGSARLQNRIDEKKSQLARTGARILQDDKAAPEAAETIAIRQTSDNSILAGLARAISRPLQDALRWMAWWMGESDDSKTQFMLNTNYLDRKLDKSDIDALLALFNADMITKESIFHELRDAGVISETVRWDDYQAKIEQQIIDRPAVAPTTNDGGASA